MSSTTKANSTPQNIDPNDPLLWFNPDALGVKPKATPQDKAPKAKGFEHGSPQSKLSQAVSGGNRKYTGSGIIKTDGVGAGPLMTTKARGKALARNAHFDTSRGSWQPNFISESHTNQGVVNRHLEGKHYARVNPEVGERFAGKKADAEEPKIPTFALRPSGPGRFEDGFSIVRSREFILVPTKTDDKK
jgi:hypothetical protein